MPEESEMSEATIPNNRNNLQQKNKKRERKRRTFEGISTEEIPYPKKSKMTSDLQLKADDIEITHSTNSQLHTVIENIRMISHALELPDVPMWVTYDLAIAKVAYQIQAMEKPHFDNLFIHLGPFHIMMAYFKAIVPLSMCHLDGTICKTDKSALMKTLEKEVQHEQPRHIDVLIIDGFFLLHTMKNVPKNFGNISKKMLQIVTQLQASRIDVIFDQYFTPSIKDYEHSQRFECAQLEFTITGPEQVIPSDFTKALKNFNFKEALVDFFISHWATDEVVPFIRNKIININFRQSHSFTVNSSNHVVSSVDEELSCPEHEEADNKIVYHACNINYQANIVIRSVDTDIAAIILGNMHHLKNNSRVWMLTGTGNNLRYVDLTKIHAELGESICRSLPGFHAITGCDCNPAFFRKGKLKPYKILKKHQEYQKAFMKFGNNELIEDNDEQQNVFNIVQKFICNVYNVGGIIDVDAARLQIFIDSYTGDQLPNYVSDSLQIISETDEEGDLDINQADWSSSDEDDEDIDDNNENSEHY
ncbi:unnamed protein product [Parnassius apollo]|uniref:(apollo) hypothetical protein n=1 Tax=Parnassius apollo TaxID=110799 RepID=A0A8S3XDW1_PARAO|nr:unnamed protein product [Parnassius apollo]